MGKRYVVLCCLPMAREFLPVRSLGTTRLGRVHAMRSRTVQRVPWLACGAPMGYGAARNADPPWSVCGAAVGHGAASGVYGKNSPTNVYPQRYVEEVGRSQGRRWRPRARRPHRRPTTIKTRNRLTTPPRRASTPSSRSGRGPSVHRSGTGLLRTPRRDGHMRPQLQPTRRPTRPARSGAPPPSC